MAMRPCRECGQDVSTKAKTCPNCGIKKPGRTEYGWKSLLFVLLFLVGFVTWVSSGDYDYAPPEPDAQLTTIDLNAAVQNTGTEILVTNNNGFAWSNCEIQVNDGFTQEIARIDPGQQAAGGLMAFTRRDGERFQPSLYAVKNVAIDCDTPNGDGWYYGTF